MRDKKTIGFIGYGKMGDAIGSAIQQANLAKSIIATEENHERQAWIKQQRQSIDLVSLHSLIQTADLIFLAIKPQKLTELSESMPTKFSANQLIISMLAGIPIKTCSHQLDHSQIVRVMPNTPAVLGKGVTGVYYPNQITDDQKSRCIEIFSTFGETVVVQDETHLDIITAISGSGPAFFYRMVDAFIDFSISKGLPKSLAEKAAIATMIGSGYMLSEFGNPKKQISHVSSPNGTTVSGLKKMDDHHFDNIINDVLNSTLNRAIELSKEC